MRIAIVVQRFGTEIIGGAERHALDYAKKFNSALGWDVEIFTTCAIDYKTWENYYDPGSMRSDFGIVRRFPVSFPRSPLFFSLFCRMFNRLLLFLAKRQSESIIGMLLEKAWFTLQGPYCPTLIETLYEERNRFDVVFFFTYLYYPTLRGLPLLREKSVLIPTAHDEPPFYFGSVKKLFSEVRAVLYSSKIERDLIKRVHPHTTHNLLQAGVGIEPIPGNKKSGDYLLYLGRISKGKNCDRLIELFLEYMQEVDHVPLRLVLAGQAEIDIEIPNNRSITYLGPVSEEKKNELIAGCLCVVNSSPKESLSLVVLEAVSARKPLMLNADCELFRDYASVLPIITLYRDAVSFRAAITKSMEWGRKRSSPEFFDLAEEWLNHNYTWDTVLASIQKAAESLKQTL
ncbi:MAG: glycosyltransferase [Oligoflexales bacterium]